MQYKDPNNMHKDDFRIYNHSEPTNLFIYNKTITFVPIDTTNLEYLINKDSMKEIEYALTYEELKIIDNLKKNHNLILENNIQQLYESWIEIGKFSLSNGVSICFNKDR